MRFFIAVVAVCALTSCGGGGARVSGPISEACMKAGRSAANPSTCSCIQVAANRTLGNSEQKRAATFFGDPQKAQDARSSTSSFWKRYREFAETAEAMCRA